MSCYERKKLEFKKKIVQDSIKKCLIKKCI